MANVNQWRKSVFIGSLAMTALAASLFTTNLDVASLSSALGSGDINIKPAEDEERRHLLVSDPKSVELRAPSLPVEDAANRQLTLDHLKKSELIWFRPLCIPLSCPSKEEKSAELASASAIFADLDKSSLPLEVCGRTFSRHAHPPCEPFDRAKPVLLLHGSSARGRTGNNLVELLHGVQYAANNAYQLGIMYDSWAMTLVTEYWAANNNREGVYEGDDALAETIEEIFCAKVFRTEEDLAGLDVTRADPWALLFGYDARNPIGEYMARQLGVLQRMWDHHNTGGLTRNGKHVKDVCSGIDAIFGRGDERRDAVYSVIHSRSQEGHPGVHHLKVMSQRSGCDISAALHMEPDYIKSILRPLGMLSHPVVFIGDGENPTVLERLLADPELGPLIRVPPGGSSWIGGDFALGAAANVFVGNPASSFANFIVKSRLALGMGHNEMFRARDENGEWRTVCGDHCTFDLCP